METVLSLDRSFICACLNLTQTALHSTENKRGLMPCAASLSTRSTPSFLVVGIRGRGGVFMTTTGCNEHDMIASNINDSPKVGMPTKSHFAHVLYLEIPHSYGNSSGERAKTPCMPSAPDLVFQVRRLPKFHPARRLVEERSR